LRPQAPDAQMKNVGHSESELQGLARQRWSSAQISPRPQAASPLQPVMQAFWESHEQRGTSQIAGDPVPPQSLSTWQASPAKQAPHPAKAPGARQRKSGELQSSFEAQQVAVPAQSIAGQVYGASAREPQCANVSAQPQLSQYDATQSGRVRQAASEVAFPHGGQASSQW